MQGLLNVDLGEIAVRSHNWIKLTCESDLLGLTCESDLFCINYIRKLETSLILLCTLAARELRAKSVPFL